MSLITLVKFDPDSEREVAELTRQRMLCGWGLEKIEYWRKQVREGKKGLKWIFRDSTPEALAHFTAPIPLIEPLPVITGGGQGPPPADLSFRPIGHASLDWEDDKQELELASRELGNVTVSSFFILPSECGRGLGNVVMRMLESAAESPEFGARYLTLNTLDGDIAWDAEYWKALGHATPERSNEAWYLRLGFEVFRRGVPRYEDIAPRTGVPILHNAVYMRKLLKSDLATAES